MSTRQPLLTLALAVGATLAVTSCAESQTLRERIQDRREERQAAREQGGGGLLGRRGGAGAAAGGGALEVPDGAELLTITQDGRERSVLVHVPANLSGSPGAVFVLHGGGGNAGRTFETVPMIGASDQAGFLAVYPDAGGELWNDGRNATAGGANDVGYMRLIVERLQQEYGLDPSRVFFTGLSNGGIFAYKIACDAPDLAAGIAPVAANMPDALLPVCRPASGVPVMMFSGTADQLMPYQGGRPELDELIQRVRGPATDTMSGAPRTVEFWAGVNRCDGAREADLPVRVDDGTSVTEIDYQGCDGGAVTLFEVEGGGHAWPGAGTRETRIGGVASGNIDATSTMVGFFQGLGL